jgi:hypothetical protein
MIAVFSLQKVKSFAEDATECRPETPREINKSSGEATPCQLPENRVTRKQNNYTPGCQVRPEGKIKMQRERQI